MDLALTAGRLRALAPKASPAIVDGLVAGQGVLATYGITTALRHWHFLAQGAHESAGLKTTVEYASGKAYEGRPDLGNTQPGDGVRFKGRGLLQLTGRANYREMGRILGLALEDQPELAADPAISLRIACEYWRSRSINALADKDDLEAVTRKVNGGLNGLADRRAYLARARTIWPVEVPAAAWPTLRRGDEGETVSELQVRLASAVKEARFNGLPRIDGDFGAQTERVLIAFQKKRGLVPDGVCGPKTWAALARGA